MRSCIRLHAHTVHYCIVTVGLRSVAVCGNGGQLNNSSATAQMADRGAATAEHFLLTLAFTTRRLGLALELKLGLGYTWWYNG